MENTLETINKEREAIISTKYALAAGELTAKAKNNLFAKEFLIQGGCDTLEITKELAKRFAANGIIADVVVSGGIFGTSYSLAINLPENSVRGCNVENNEQKEVRNTIPDESCD